MATCETCGRTSDDAFRFCPHCGAPMGPAPTPRTERRTVTILFCDLVGFTSTSDGADPEDVRAVLEPFHSIAKGEIERHGGTLDKFIGDAAMGVFGSPVAHEDDAERAVRTGLAILAAIDERNGRVAAPPLTVRVGVNTGEAIVTLAAGVQIGENVAGDVVNTASRLQSAAPPGSLVVGEPTYRATRNAVTYESLPPLQAKGKTQPLHAWRAVDIRPLPTISEREATTPFVGRKDELLRLRDAFERSARDGRTGVVVIVGEPGIGKSRLVAELRATLARDVPGVLWRRGRCLPYGDGITFWALGEIVKEQTGVLESDTPEERERKLAAALSDLVEDPTERSWMHGRVAPLIGGTPGSPAERAEAFAAWRRLLVSMASRPLVLVFEDVHWADPSMIAFLDDLVAEPPSAPILVVATARREVFGLAPQWDEPHATPEVLHLGPLGEADTEALAEALLSSAPGSSASTELLLERSGGNPLYAEELARMLQDRGAVEGPASASAKASTRDLPDSIESLIAARLDTLRGERKRLLQDASVVGRAFWPGAVASVGDSTEDGVVGALGPLGRAEFVKPVPVSSLEGQLEFVFWHGLIRDVAYAQLPRAERATKHRRAASWLESVVGDRLADIAEILAHHAVSAMELAAAAGDGEGAADARHAAARYLRAAGMRSAAIDVGKAEEQLRRALELTDADDPERPRCLAALGEASLHVGRLDAADERYREAIEEFRARGSSLEAGDAMVRRSVVLEYRGKTAESRDLLSHAIELLNATAPGPELARALATSAGSYLVAGRYDDVIAEADRTLALADVVGEPNAAARARGFRGYALAIQGDPDGIAEQRAALESLRALGHGRAVAITYNNLGSCLSHFDGPSAGLAVLREGLAFARERGLREVASALQSSMVTVLFEVGAWDEMLTLVGVVIEEAHAQEQGFDEVFAEADRALVAACREGGRAIAVADSVLERARPMEDAPLVLQALLASMTAHADAGDDAVVRELVAEALRITDHDVVVRAPELAMLARAAVGTGDMALATKVLDGSEDLILDRYRLSRLAASAVLAEARGEHDDAAGRYREAADRWERHGHAFEHAHALFGLGRCLVQLGRVAEARSALTSALAGFEALGAEPVAQLVREASARRDR